MAVEIVTGEIGSGKTRYCLDSISKTRADMPNCRCVMLVPTYYSHETEKLIVDEFGGTGLNNIEVTSFEKLARSLIQNTKNYLSAPGKQAIICRAVELCLRELESRQGEFDGRLVNSISKPGFADIASSLISEMKRYVISGDVLRAQAAETENKTLKQKLEILAMICENYDLLLSETDYVDSDEDLMRLSAYVCDMFGDNTHIWIDKFDEFLPQQLQVVYALINSGADITFTFNVCREYGNTYYGTIRTIENICAVCDPLRIRLDGGMKHIKNAPDLKFLFDTWFDRAVYNGRVENAELFQARDAYTETEHIASRILDLVREDKYRFRDIAVICGNQDSYSHIIEAVFEEYEIPYYSDYKISVASHPIAVQILSLFDIIERNWDYSSMFEYLRAGFVYTTDDNGKYKRLKTDDIDILENHVLEYGIRGKNMWARSWSNGYKRLVDEAFGKDTQTSQDKFDRIDNIRKTVVEPISKFCTAAGESVTVYDYCCAVYEFLEDINLYGGLRTEVFSAAVNQAEKDVQRFSQIWNLILDILDQLNTALGTVKVTSAEFFNYMRAAMTKCEIRTVPSGVDRVFIGTTEKNQARNEKVLFMAGAVSGTFPSEETFEGFLSNADREYLESKNVNVAPVTNKKSSKLYNSVYRSLSAVTDKLCISYPIQTSDGKPYRPSRLVSDIASKLKRIRIYDDIAVLGENEKTLFISSPKATMHKMLIRPKNHPLWQFVNEWYSEHGEWKNKLFTVNETRDNFENRKISLNKKYAGMLYDDSVIYSATRLDLYANCPFAYFLKYGLKAYERDEWELSAADTGNYAHELIRLFCEYIDNSDKYSWDSLTDNECEEIVRNMVGVTLENINNSDIIKKEKTSHILNRMGKTVAQAVKMVRRTISSGEYGIDAYEKEFKVMLSDKVGVKGVIDRLDKCSHDGIDEYRIVDYKTGPKEFTISDIYNGIDMQPVIYAAAVCIEKKNAEISGTYYSGVRNNFVIAKSNNGEDTILKALKGNTELSGATFVEVDEDGSVVGKSADRIESSQSRETGSIFFNLDKEGNIKIDKSTRPRQSSKKLIEHVTKKIKEFDQEMRDGNIKLSPMTAYNGGSCKYCEYSSVCKFDYDLAEAREIKEQDEEAWRKIEEGE